MNTQRDQQEASEPTPIWLDAIDRAGRERLKVTIVDIASSTGAAELDEVWKRIFDRYKSH